MELQIAIDFYLIAKKNKLAAEQTIEEKLRELTSFNDKSIGQHKYELINRVKKTVDLELHRKTYTEAEQALIKAFQKATEENNTFALKKLQKYGFDKESISNLFNQTEYEPIRLLLVELAILSA